MAIYGSLGALEAALKAATQTILISDLVPIVQSEIRAQEQSLVYGDYTPVIYQRRNSLGNSFQIEHEDEYSVRIYDIASPNRSVFGTAYKGPPGSFAQWINDGNVPNVFNEETYPWMGARAFYDAAAAMCAPKINSAVRAGIKKLL